MSILFFPKELDCHESCNDNNYASHHLVNASSCHGKSHKHQRWSTNVKESWNGDPYWIKRWSLLDWSWITQSFHTVQDHAGELSNEHDCALEVWMSEFLWTSISICSNNCIILHFHYNSVTCSKSQHEHHNAIQLRIGNTFLFLVLWLSLGWRWSR